MKIYSRAQKVAEGKRLHTQDMARGGQFVHFRATDYAPFSAPHQRGFQCGGALHRDTGGPAGYSTFGMNPMFQPATALGTPQVPPLSGSGGYSSPVTKNTAPGAVMMAMQPRADGGTTFADRVEAANQPSANVEDAPAESAQDILFSAMKSAGVDPLRMSRFADQPPATELYQLTEPRMVAAYSVTLRI
jgi:hypothetical protein